MQVIRSAQWDGPPPMPGDVLTFDDCSHAVVVHVVAGAGLGHYTMTVDRRPGPYSPPNVYRYRWSDAGP